MKIRPVNPMVDMSNSRQADWRGKWVVLAITAYFLMSSSAFAWGWACRDNLRQPIENPTIYLGDPINFYFNINAEAASAGYKSIGAGTVPSSEGMDWEGTYYVDEYPDGYGGYNVVVRSDTYRGTELGTWFYSLWIGWGSYVGINGHWYTGSGSWNEGSATFASSAYTVSPLTPPSEPSAVTAGTDQIDLAWTKGVSGGSAKDTLILRKSSEITTPPRARGFVCSRQPDRWCAGHL